MSSEPFHPIPDRQPRWVSADEAVSHIKSGMTVFVHGCAATPLVLLDSLATHGKREKLKDIQLIHIHTEGPGVCMQPDCEGIFRSNSLFIGGNARKAVNDGRADCTPIFLGETPLLFRRGIIPLDAALVTVSPPDEHGFCSLGPSVDLARAAVQHTKYLIGQVNSNLPRTFGDGIVHISHFDALVKADFPLPEIHKTVITPIEEQIGQHIANNLVADGATLQMGIGSIPDAVLSKLTSHRDLGIHTEMISDGIIQLVRKGIVTNANKKIQPGKIVSAFAFGTTELYRFMNNNPFIAMCDVAFTNNVSVISQNPKVTAINSCIEVDLTGQVCADSIGTRMYSGVGGQIDFMRGSALSQDGLGKPILAMASTTEKGVSKIAPMLKSGAGVVTTRAHVHYLVTEYGIAYLFGKSFRQRAYELIRVAHPDHREVLEKAAFERLKVMPSP